MGQIWGPDRIVTDGLVLSLDAADKNSYPGSGTTWTDMSGNGNNGTLTNGPTFSSANGGSIVLDGTNDYVATNVSRSATTNQDYTIMLVFRISSYTSTDMRIFGGNKLNDASQFGAGFTNTTFRLWLDNPMNWYNTNFVASTNIIYHLTVVHSGTDTLTYVNGVLDSTITGRNSYFDVFGFGSPYILQYGTYFNGNFYTAQIYSRALSPTEVLQNYNATKSRFGL